MRVQLPLAAVAAALFVQAAHAGGTPPGTAFFNGSATVDNLFTVSISNSPTTAGTTVFSGDNWQAMFSGSLLLTTPGTYYLQVFAQDTGQPEMFIGHFTLSGDATFANGTQDLLTNSTDWAVSNTGFGQNTVPAFDIGPNGAGPWGNFPTMGGAHFIWAPQYGNGQAYFTAVLTVAPTPSTGAAFGLVSLVAARRRRA